jgi:capsular exopolysaccharide synthesis family protein
MTLTEPPPLDDSSRLREYLGVLRVRKWTVIITTLLAVLAAAFYIQRTTPTYTATAKVQVRNPLAGLPGNSGNQSSAPNMQTEQTLVTSTNVVSCARQFYNFSTGGPVVVPSPSPSKSPSPSPSASRSSPSPGPSGSRAPSQAPTTPAPSPSASPAIPAASDPAKFCSPDALQGVNVEGARQGLHVASAPQTTIMNVDFSSHNKSNATAWANAFANAYVEFKTLDAVATVEGLQAPIQSKINALNTEKTRDENALLAAINAGDQLKQQYWNDQLNQVQQQLNQQTTIAAQYDTSLVYANAPKVILDATLPGSPSAPKKKLIIAAGLLLGLVLGIALAFIRERLDDSLRGRGDLEDLLGAPVLAVVPRVSGWKKKDDTHLISIEQPKASVAEVYRTLRTSVLFASAQRGLKTLMVTSPTAGEGKTTTASNLAVVLADAGKRVILVSSDLRKPRVHRFFGLSNEKGLSTVLVGEVKPWEAMADPGRGHLRVLTSGPVPAHPAELLQSEQMGELIEELREVADFVILDTAPVLLVADALAIAPLADGVLLIVDAENTHRGAVIQAREQLEQVGAPLIGAVLNNFDPSKARSPYYGYYGSYWHRYRYSGYYGFSYGEDGGRRGAQAALPGEGRSD